MSRIVPVLTVAAVLAVSGLVSGILNERWLLSNSAAGKKVVLPASFGDWDSREAPVTEAELKASDATSIDRRWYSNRTSGHVVLVTLVFGKVGPVAVHTPDVCFRGSGFEEVAAPVRREIEQGQADRFLVRRFQKQVPSPMAISVHYAWSAGGPWQVPEHPRIAFAGQRSLCKLYAVEDTPTDASLGGDEPAVILLRALLPLLGDSISPPS